MKINQPLKKPYWNSQVMDYVNDIHNKEKYIQSRCEKVLNLFHGDPGNWAVPNHYYIGTIQKNYFSARFLFSVGFYYLTLDCCRKIIESLVRFQQDMKPDAQINFTKRIENELPWKSQDLKLAKDVYIVGSASVHTQSSKI